MKKYLLVSFISFLIITQVKSQCDFIYSLSRPTGGGNLQLVKFDMENGSQSVIKDYLPAELTDYRTDAVTFDHINNRMIVVGDNTTESQSIMSINTNDGSVEYSHSVTAYNVSSVEYSNSNYKVYSLVTPYTPGNVSLVEFDLINNTETIIKTYTTAELNGFNPEGTTFDKLNNEFITITEDTAGVESIIAIDVTSGTIVKSYPFSNLGVFCVEYFGGKVYSLVYPQGGGEIDLVEFDLVNQTNTVVNTYSPNEIDSYISGTSFDHHYNKFIVYGEDSLNINSVMALDISTGSLDYFYTPTGIEVFNLESEGEFAMSVNNFSLSNEFKVFPNPSNGEVQIESDFIFTEIEILNQLGVVVKEITNPSSMVNLSGLEKGVYFIKGYGTEGTGAKKIVID